MALFKGWEKKLSTKGGTSDGTITIKNSYPFIVLNNTDTNRRVDVVSDTNGRASINNRTVDNYPNNELCLVLGKENDSDSNGYIFLIKTINGERNYYTLYGRHNIVPISNGGTNATNRKDAMSNLSFLGANLIGNTADDTITNWTNFGTGYTFFSTNVMNNQPGQYMMVLNFAYGSDVFQLGKVQAGGSLYCRGGNSSGWAQQWTEIASSATLGNYATKSYVDGKVSASAIQSLLSGGQVSVIKNIQRGVISIGSGQRTATATISSVDTNKSVVLYGGTAGGHFDDYNSYNFEARLVLNSATQVEAYRAYTRDVAYVPYQVIQFN